MTNVGQRLLNELNTVAVLVDGEIKRIPRTKACFVPKRTEETIDTPSGPKTVSVHHHHDRPRS